MIDLDITLQNYRAFPNHAPLTVRITDEISFLLGVNNVGKSALLRSFYELRDIVQTALLEKMNPDKPISFPVSTPIGFDQLAHRATPARPILLKIMSGENGWLFEIIPKSGNAHLTTLTVNVTLFGARSAELIETVDALYHKSMYVGSFRSAAVTVSASLYDIEIGVNFVREWDSWSNSSRIDHSTKVDALTQELKSLFGFDRLAISVSQEKTVLYLTSGDGRFSLGELGDGISHCVIVLGNAMIKDPAFIFIDEPEIGLHPRMQEIFVRALAAKAKFGIIATSHSIGLARSVADRILSITKDSDGTRRALPFGEHRSTTLMQSISELGYSQYAEIGGNHLLLVEGRTDIKTFREILRKFKLEQHFIIWSLNGSEWLTAEPPTIADELNELKRLNARSISVIFDSERTSDQMEMAARFQPFVTLCKSLGFNVFPTDRHSTENYITQAALNEIIPGHAALGPFEVFGSNGAKWDKRKNWLLIQKMSVADFDDTNLKTFITGTLAELVKNQTSLPNI